MTCVLIELPECYVEIRLKEGKHREKLETYCNKSGKNNGNFPTVNMGRRD